MVYRTRDFQHLIRKAATKRYEDLQSPLMSAVCANCLRICSSWYTYGTQDYTNTSYKDHLKASICNSFYIFPASAKEIENEISQLSSSKPSGPFSSILKLLKTTLSKPLELIYNLSFSTGIVPDNFKIARVIPIYKKGSHISMGN